MLDRWWIPRRAAVAVLLLGTVGTPAAAQVANETPPWSFRTRLLLTGSSDHSEPAGFTTYSALALEVAAARRLAGRFSAELSGRIESREVDRVVGSGPTERLGSLELVPVNLLLQFHPSRGGKLRPYLGAGVNVTAAWEKSGVLDSMDVKPHVGPSLQVGANLDLSTDLFLNFDLRWNTLTTDIENRGVRYTSLRIDPIALGIGLGVRF
jgi:outer membrane protein